MLRMWLTNLLLFVLLMALTMGHAHGQSAYNVDRDQKLFTAQGQTYTIVNRIGALNLTFEYVVSGSPGSLTMTITGCMRGGTCDTLDTYVGTTSSNRKVTGLYDNYVVTPTTLSGGTSPTVQMNVFFTAASSPAGAQGTQASQVQGAAANGATAVGNPLFIAWDGTAVRALKTDTAGDIATVGPAAAADGLANNPTGQLISGTGTAGPLQIVPFVFNGGTTWDRIRSASLANLATAQTLTARNSIGAQISEKGSRWMVTSSPAVSNQATASIAAEASVRHIADCVSFSGGSTTAPALTALTVNLRDGATGAGTVLWTHTVIVGAATGQNVAPFTFCGLNLVGTTNTAMTLEFSALLTNLLESVSLSGFNVN